MVAAHKAGLHPPELATHYVRVAEVPFSSERKLMSTACIDTQRAGRVIVFAKGAPDVLLARCRYEQVGGEVRPLTATRRAAVHASLEALAADALRTLGIASRLLPGVPAAAQIDERIEHELVFLGLAGLIDPPRPEARPAVQTAQQAGIRIMMITGDHPRTAMAIATELGIAELGARAYTGAVLEQMDDAALQSAVRKVSVYARVSPEHKLRIVRALQASGEVVAMTGDGVNDAPALKAADIGVAMGRTGTDVAKGAAAMILTDDNFASIVAAVEEGRAIFANIQKVLRYLLSSNMGEVLAMFFGVVLAGSLGLVAGKGELLVLPLLATQILWINLVTDTGPALALGVDPGDPSVMRRPPRPPNSRVIDRRMWGAIAGIGVVMAAATLLVLDAGLAGGMVPGNGTLTHARTLAFTTLVGLQLCNVFNARSDERSAFAGLFQNIWLWGAVLLSAGLQLLVIYLPPLQQAFSTTALSPVDWVLCLVASSSVLWLSELAKLAGRLRHPSSLATRRCSA
jgi:Ca2+-transporting ATPase